MIKILQVIASTSMGGAPEVVRLIAAHFDRKAFEMEVASSNDGPHFESIKQLGCRMHQVNIEGRSRLNPSPAFQLKKLFKDGKYDVIHLHGTRAGFWGAMASRGLAIPIIYTEHTFAFSAGRNFFSSKFFEKVERYIGHHVQRLVALSSEDATLAKDLKLAPQENIVIIKNGVEFDRFNCRIEAAKTHQLRRELGIPDNSNVVGTVGRITYQKNPERFLDIVNMLTAKHPDIVFLWIGDGELKQNMAALIKNRKMTNVIITGFRNDIPELLRLMDVFLLTSRWEGLPLSVIEAMGSGLPVVATDIRGVRELVAHWESGFLYAPSDTEKASEYLSKLLKDRNLRKKLGDAGQKMLKEELNVTRMVTAYERLYRELVRQSQNGRVFS